MRTVLPGKPQAKLQAVSTAQWEELRLVVYLSGSALVILGGPHQLLQTIYHEEHFDLDGVVVDGATGKIATCSGKEVTVYSPHGKNEGVLRWSFQSSFQIPNEEDTTLALSWGSEEELLVGSSSLKLFQTARDNVRIWNRRLPKPVKFANFSHDANLIASTGLHDRLIKLWRRQSSGSDDTRFDFTYLPHPTAVTAIHWRKPHEHEHLMDNVLYSICADSKVRIWAATDPHGLQVLQLWEEIDMQEAIQPRDLGLPSQARERYAFIIDSKDFAYGTEEAVKQGSEGGKLENHALEHLTEISRTNPEVCVVVDRRGNMSAWGLENVGCKARKNTDKFNIAHVEGVNLSFLQDVEPEESNAEFLGFCSQTADFQFTLLVHHFDGRIAWFESKLDELFDPSRRQQRLHAAASWTGHNNLIKRTVRSDSGKSVISHTNDNEALIWKQGHDKSDLALVRLSAMSCPEHIHQTCLLGEGSFIINLHRHGVSVWDARSLVAKQVAFAAFQLEGKPLCLFSLPCPGRTFHSSFVATITSKMEAIVWQIILPTSFKDGMNGRTEIDVRAFSSSRLGLLDDLAFLQPIDLAESPPTTSGFSDGFARDLVIACTNTGVLSAWTAIINVEEGTVEWLTTSNVETHIDMPFVASGSSTRKFAIVDRVRTGLTIWDSRSSQMEHDARYESSNTIQDLDWSSNPNKQSLLAVGFPYKVIILAQMRYDFMNAGPSWAPIQEFNIKELTSHPIGDSTWLGSGNLVVGAGNQLYVYDEDVRTSDDMVRDLSMPLPERRCLSKFDLVTYLNGPLPIFHPQFLMQCILAGKLVHVQEVLVGLYKSLKFFVAGDELDSYVSMSPIDFYTEQEDVSYATKKEMRSSYADFVDENEPDSVTEELATSLNENLANLAIPQLSNHEQIHLANIIKCVAIAEKHRRSVDHNAMRYLLLFFKQNMMRNPQVPEAPLSVAWKQFVWAYHSSSQEILVDLVSRHSNGRMLWKHARESGMFIWMTDLTALRAQFEVIARNEYTKTDEKNPIDCSLYYLALKKKSVLVGLWRMAAWNREQAGTQKLLRNDFSESRWKTAALKNAYALLGKRRFEYAAAFFLLAGNLQDAVNVCCHHMGDLQLAIAVARVYDGDDSIVLRSLLEEKVLPQAASEGNRWLATWAFWMLGRHDMGVRVLMSPVHTLIDSPEPPSRQARSYLSSDPALIVLYKQLRGKLLRNPKDASAVSPREEWDFVIQTARTYARMGCDLLALDLVRNWEFLKQPRETSTNGTQSTDPRKMSRRRSKDIPTPTSPLEQKTKPGGKPAPTVFEEPSASSLLDSFGF